MDQTRSVSLLLAAIPLPCVLIAPDDKVLAANPPADAEPAKAAKPAAGVSGPAHLLAEWNRLAARVAALAVSLYDQSRGLLHLDDGRVKETVVLNDPGRALHIGPMVWHELDNFAPQTVILVIASTLYDESEYLRDYEAFRREAEAASRA